MVGWVDIPDSDCVTSDVGVPSTYLARYNNLLGYFAPCEVKPDTYRLSKNYARGLGRNRNYNTTEVGIWERSG